MGIRTRLREECAQATVEMAVVTPVLLVLALIAYNVMLFAGAVARFDRVVPDIVLAHAVADALLGAIRGGDIGKLFPDTDPEWEGADSMKLLAAVAAKVREEGFQIIDVDSVIAAQAPKMAPHRQQMRENLAAAMGIAVDNVGVKATTTEHLGFEGRQEGISATAVALLARCS